MNAEPLTPAEIAEFEARAASFPTESMLLRRFLATIKRRDEAADRLRKIRRQFRHEPTMAGGRWVLPSGDVIAAAIDDVLEP